MMNTTERQGQLMATDQSIHTLLLNGMGHLHVDKQEARCVEVTCSRIRLMLHDTTTIDCTPAAFWNAFVGAAVIPTTDEVGYWFAQAVMLEQQLRAWKVSLELVGQQVADALAQSLPALSLPQNRLDAFTEECLARCDARATAVHVQALAHLLQQSPETVSTWLHERGKVVMPDEPSPSAQGDQVVSSPTMHEVQPDKQAEQINFLWNEEQVQQLRTSFLALTPEEQGNVRVAALLIAEQRRWPVSKVRYKLYSLHWKPVQPEEPSSLVSDNVLESGVEVLKRGAFLWDVQIDGQEKLQRWGLDYAYGKFPYAPQTPMLYKERFYMLEQANTSLLTVKSVEREALAEEGVQVQREREVLTA